MQFGSFGVRAFLLNPPVQVAATATATVERTLKKTLAQISYVVLRITDLSCPQMALHHANGTVRTVLRRATALISMQCSYAEVFCIC